MATGTRIRVNFIDGQLTDALTDSATTMKSDGLENLPVIDHATTDEYAAVSIGSEIVHVTAHTADSDEATIERGQEGTTAVAHDEGAPWDHAPTTEDYENSGASHAPVQTVKTDTFSESLASQSVESGDVTGLTVQITPSSAGAKVRVDVSMNVAVSGVPMSVAVTLYRNGSPVFRGDEAGSRARVTQTRRIENTNTAEGLGFSFVDEPGTTDEVTYSIRLRHASSSSQTVYVNHSATDTDSPGVGRSASSIIAQEVG